MKKTITLFFLVSLIMTFSGCKKITVELIDNKEYVLSGRLIYPDGTGITGVSIYLDLFSDDDDLYLETDSEGNFQYHCKDLGDIKDISANEFDSWGYRNFTLSSFTMSPQFGKRDEEITIELKKIALLADYYYNVGSNFILEYFDLSKLHLGAKTYLVKSISFVCPQINTIDNICKVPDNLSWYNYSLGFDKNSFLALNPPKIPYRKVTNNTVSFTYSEFAKCTNGTFISTSSFGGLEINSISVNTPKNAIDIEYFNEK